MSWKEMSQPPVRVNDSWFRACINANMVWPQTGFGITILTANAILKDRPQSFQQLQDSQLSGSQIGELAQRMQTLHSNNGVRGVRYEDTEKESGKQLDDTFLVTNERLKNVWNVDAKVGVSRLLVEYDSYLRTGQQSGSNTREYYDKQGFSQMAIQRLDALMISPKLNQLAQIMDSAARVLQSGEGLALSKRYREALIGKNTNTATEVKAEMQDYLLNQLSAHYPMLREFIFMSIVYL